MILRTKIKVTRQTVKSLLYVCIVKSLVLAVEWKFISLVHNCPFNLTYLQIKYSNSSIIRIIEYKNYRNRMKEKVIFFNKFNICIIKWHFQTLCSRFWPVYLFMKKMHQDLYVYSHLRVTLVSHSLSCEQAVIHWNIFFLRK